MRLSAHDDMLFWYIQVVPEAWYMPPNVLLLMWYSWTLVNVVSQFTLLPVTQNSDQCLRRYAVHQIETRFQVYSSGICLFRECLPITILHCTAKESSTVNVKGPTLSQISCLAYIYDISD
jgi:hypothetical protein